MLSLKHKILIPMFIIIILTPIITLIVVNISLDYAEERIARQELQNILDLLQNRENLIDDIKGNTTIDTNNGRLLIALQSTRFNVNIDYAFFDSNYNPKSRFNSKSLLKEDFLKLVAKKLPDKENEEIYKMDYQKDTYLYTTIKMDAGLLKPYILLVAKVDFAKPIVAVMNTIFIIIGTIVVVIGLVLTYLIMKGIIKPIRQLCGYTKVIGRGEFIDIPTNDSFLEIHQLSTHMGDMSKQLHKLSEGQKNFMQNISHELRTPLMAIGSYAEGLRTGVFTDVNHASDIILEESQRLNNLVEQILTLSRIENSDYNYEMSKLVLSNSLLEYYQSLNGIAMKYDKKLMQEIEADDIIIEANDLLLTQIIYNIVSNCLRYADTSVGITLTKTASNALLTIYDDGPGFDPEDLPHIFERFYKGKTGKFGLGLAIAKTSTELMGGTIQAANSNKGAIFRITFPRC